MAINILLVDNGNITRFSLEQLIHSQADKFRLVGSFSSCMEIMTNHEHLSFDIILLGIDPEDRKEQECALQLIATDGKAKVLLLQRTMEDDFYDRAILIGAKGVIDKNAPLTSILKAVEKVCDGQLWINQATTKRLIKKLAQAALIQNETKSQLISKLTSKEHEILHIVVTHISMPVKILADRIGIKESTFRNHLTSIYEKLNIQGKNQLIDYLQRNNFDPDSQC